MRMETPQDKFRLTYNAKNCWQYEIRVQNLARDLGAAGLTQEEASNLKVQEFEFKILEAASKKEIKAVSLFIENHEWLGRVPPRISHRFIATYHGQLAGVLLLSCPNQWSRKLKEIFLLERLISRGACISWSPKNLASRFNMWALRWMVQNTEYRIFSGYSDPRAKELGTIYQACNFYYMGKNFGSDRLYLDPEYPERGWFSERKFSTFHQIKTYATKLHIKWQNSWNEKTRIFWEKVPVKEKIKLLQYQEFHKSYCLVKEIPLKHKYILPLGRNKAEQRKLNRLLLSAFPNLNKKYPKDR